MHPAFERTDHRPWPVPKGRWSWRQSWGDLLFLHWPVPTEAVRHLVPEPLQVDTFEGVTYVGLVPFRMSGVMRRPLPDLPWVSAFPEVNVRLYVTLGGKPGVWFLSLDATNPVAVWAARRLFHLPYFRAQMRVSESAGQIHATSRRAGAGPELAVRYAPTGAPRVARPGTLEHWLTERYCLYAQAPDGGLWRTCVHHAPWPLQDATAELEHNTLFEPHALAVHGPPPLRHFSRALDVVVWSPETAQ
jgi:hypothetical protein